jgi:Na+-transporting methylmalonyl-CoA/oxaloacetate decarboxylase gamma subunit
MTKGRVIGLGIGIVLIVAAFGIVLWQGMSQTTNNVAFAQGAATATPAASPTTAPSTAPQQQTQTIGDTFWTLLAGKLGVSAEDLKKKALETRLEMIDAAVKDGRITQAQADALKQRITSNNIIAPIPLPRAAQGNQNPNNPQMPGRGFGPFQNPGKGNKQNPAPFGNGFGMAGRGMLGGSLEQLEAVAKVLKLDAKALIEQMAQGKTLAEIAKAQNVDEAAVKKAIIDARTAQIDQLLAYGLISQVQAEQMKARLTPDAIDLSRPLWFQFRNRQNAPGTSQLLPDFGMGQVFGDPNGEIPWFGETFLLSPDMMQPFDGMFGMDGMLDLLQDNIQTQ